MRDACTNAASVKVCASTTTIAFSVFVLFIFIFISSSWIYFWRTDTTMYFAFSFYFFLLLLNFNSESAPSLANITSYMLRSCSRWAVFWTNRECPLCRHSISVRADSRLCICACVDIRAKIPIVLFILETVNAYVSIDFEWWRFKKRKNQWINKQQQRCIRK